MEKIYFDKIKETIYTKTLDNGLTVVFAPKSDFNKAYASVTTKFGSLNNNFILNDEEFEITDGIAHFLEHKMFEKEDGDAFVKFSKFGGSANAYTSFDHTCYYFTCCDHFSENFEVLLSMMTTPYFTDETVEKEKGIIGEELKMYEDDSSWILYYETLKNLYESHPLRIDIGGTIPSIAKITAADLHHCYNTFYHPSNLIITVVGNFDEESALNMIDKYYGAITNDNELHNIHTEDTEVFKDSSRITMDVNISKCAIGFKQDQVLFYDYKRESALNIYLRMLFSKSSSNYELLSSKDLYLSYSYNELDTTGFVTISSDVNDENDFFVTILDILKGELNPDDFNRYKNKNIGATIRAFNSVDNFGSIINNCYVNDYELEDVINSLESLTFEEMLNYAKELFVEKNMTKVVIEKKS